MSLLQISYALKFREADFPTEWADDVRMNFLFSPFRERDANPEGYDLKLNFWTNNIQNLCTRSSCPVVSSSSLAPALFRKGRLPQCLDVVLGSMERRGLIMPLSDFSRLPPGEGWLQWGVNMLVQRPISWGMLSVKKVLSMGGTECSQYVVLSAVKDIADKILQRYRHQVGTLWGEGAVFVDQLRAECRDICAEPVFTLALLQLQRDREATVFEENKEKIIKFRKDGQKDVEPLTELDKGTLNLKRVQISIENDIDVIQDNINSCQQIVKKCIKDGCKTKAMNALKKRKRLEELLKKKSTALDNVENLLCQLKNKGSEKMVLEAYRSGAQAMKKSLGGDLYLDDVDDVMADVKEVLEDYSEVQRTLGQNMLQEEEEELEGELRDLLANEEASRPAPPASAKTPQRALWDEDIAKRLAALRSPPEEGPPAKKPMRFQLAAAH